MASAAISESLPFWKSAGNLRNLWIDLEMGEHTRFEKLVAGGEEKDH
jgi:hypothetical protein